MLLTISTTHVPATDLGYLLHKHPGRAHTVSVPFGTGSDGGTVTIGEPVGVESVTLTPQQIPGHNHSLNAAATGSLVSPQNAFPAVPGSSVGGLQTYAPTGGTLVNLIPTMLQTTGGSQPHDNFQPYLCVSFIISLFGIFPSPT